MLLQFKGILGMPVSCKQQDPPKRRYTSKCTRSQETLSRTSGTYSDAVLQSPADPADTPFYMTIGLVFLITFSFLISEFLPDIRHCPLRVSTEPYNNYKLICLQQSRHCFSFGSPQFSAINMDKH
jgi:hypothetical protein